MVEKLNSLDQVIGHQNIIKWFKSALQRDKVPEVIMLQGPTGIGKTSIAKIVACELACFNNPERLEEMKDIVINKGKNTDCVKVYNMSNLKSQDAVNEVKADLNVGFSSTKRKVIIMDEAHGMSEEAQDSLLTTFESLPLHVYVIVCSTELDSFREAFVGRCVLRRLTNLSQSEMRTFLKARIDQLGLKFELSTPMVIALISNYTGREPRRAIKLLDSFEEGSTVTVSELETFFNVYESKQIVTLIRYLYTGEILAGLDFIADFDYNSTFTQSLLEVLRVAQNGTPLTLDKDSVLYVRELVLNNGLDKLLGFTIDCSTASRLTRNLMSGYFLKWCSKADSLYTKPKKVDEEKVQIEDLRLMRDMMTEKEEVYSNNSSVARPTLQMLFDGGETIE